MLRRVLLLTAALCLITVPARAQFVVIDPANLVQTTLMAFRLQQHYAELRAQYLTVLRMSQGLGNLSRYRIPAIAISTVRPETSAACPDVAAVTRSASRGGRPRRRSSRSRRR